MKKGILLFLVCLFSLCFFQKANATEETPVFDETDMAVEDIEEIEIINGEEVSKKVYDVYQELKTGDKVLFEIDFLSSDPVSVMVFAEGKTENEEDSNLCYEKKWDLWKGKSTIEFETTKDMTYFSICIDYHDINLAERVCKISNIRVTNSDSLGEIIYEIQADKQNIMQEKEEVEEDKSSQISAKRLTLIIVAVFLGITATILVLINENKRKNTRRNSRKAER